MRPLHVYGIGLLGPGLDGWTAGQKVLVDQTTFDETARPNPAPSALSPNERRRSSETVKWALAAADEACNQAAIETSQLQTVFASSDGDGAILDQLCVALNSPERSISPTVFHHSVHNSPAGYWHIAHDCKQASSSLSCYDDSFCGGLLEAAALVTTEKRPVLLVSYDLPPPPLLYPAHPIRYPLAIALVLGESASPRSLARLDMELQLEPATLPTLMNPPSLERLRRENPAGRGLPLLAAVANRHPGTVYLEFLNSLQVRISITPCPS